MEKLCKYKHASLLELRLRHLLVVTNGKDHKYNHMSHGKPRAGTSCRKRKSSVSKITCKQEQISHDSRQVIASTEKCKATTEKAVVEADPCSRVEQTTEEEAKLAAEYER